MVAVPCIKYGLLRMRGNGAGLVEGRLRMVSLPGGVPVELLEVDSPPEGPVLLGADDHSVAPSVRVVPRGTCSKTPRRTSLSKPALTPSCQWMGIGIGVWHGFSVAIGSMFRVRGGPDIMGRVWCSHTLTTCSVERPERWSFNLLLWLETGGLWVVGAVGLWWGMSRSWGLTVVSLDVPALSLVPLGCVCLDEVAANVLVCRTACSASGRVGLVWVRLHAMWKVVREQHQVDACG